MELDAQSLSEVGTIGSSLAGRPGLDRMSITKVVIAESLITFADDKENVKFQVEELRSKDVTPDPEVVNPRGYQREMLEQSLKRNVIVAVGYRELRLFESYRLT